MIDKNKWDTLNQAEQRVALAKEVLELLGTGKIQQPAGPGSAYFRILGAAAHGFDNSDSVLDDKVFDWQADFEEGSGQKMLQDPDVRCDVCIKGAFVVAHVLNFNHTPAAKLVRGDIAGDDGIAYARRMIELFGVDWNKLEALYECYAWPSTHTDSDWRNMTRQERFNFLMEHLIANNGAEGCIRDLTNHLNHRTIIHD